MKLTIGTFLTIALIGLLMIGCGSSGDKVLAKVGDYEITASEFGEYFASVRMPFPTAQDEFNKRREALDSLIVSRLLIQGAYEMGVDQSAELARVVLANKDKFLVDVLLNQEVVQKAKPTDAEIKQFWDRLEYKVKASHILVSDLDTANALIARIQDGESFEKLAHEYSIDRSAEKNKGDLGFFTWGQMVDPFQKAVWQMEPGELSPPVKSDYGYHIIKLVDRLPNEYRTDLEKMRPEITDQLYKRNQRRIGRAYFENLQKRYPIIVDTATCDYLIKKRENIYPPMLLKTFPKNDFDLEQLDRNEKELVLAHWEGGQLTVLEYLQAIKSISPNFKPDLDDYDSLATVIFNLKMSDILIVEAHQQGIDANEVYQQKLKLFKELAMADIMRNDSIPMPEPPDDMMARKYYDQHPEEYTTPAKVQVYEILLSDEVKAREIAKNTKSLKEFKNLAMDLTERPGKRAVKGDLGEIQRKYYPEIYDLAVKTDVDKIGGPVVTYGKYSIFWVADKTTPELKDYLGVKRDIMQKLIADQRRNTLNDWLEKRRVNTKIEINEDALWSTIDMSKYEDAEGE